MPRVVQIDKIPTKRKTRTSTVPIVPVVEKKTEYRLVMFSHMYQDRVIVTLDGSNTPHSMSVIDFISISAKLGYSPKGSRYPVKIHENDVLCIDWDALKN